MFSFFNTSLGTLVFRYKVSYRMLHRANRAMERQKSITLFIVLCKMFPYYYKLLAFVFIYYTLIIDISFLSIITWKSLILWFIIKHSYQWNLGH